MRDITFRKIPERLHLGLENWVKELKSSKNKSECLNKAYGLITSRYRGERINTYLKFWHVFYNLKKIWKKQGFLHCTNMNYLLRILLIKSGFFKDSDIKTRWSIVWYISPHQYLQIKISNKKHINIDMWGRAYGIKFGDFAHGFH
jgi:hypothetical protein